jgi:hypothetical protein
MNLGDWNEEGVRLRASTRFIGSLVCAEGQQLRRRPRDVVLGVAVASSWAPREGDEDLFVLLALIRSEGVRGLSGWWLGPCSWAVVLGYTMGCSAR